MIIEKLNKWYLDKNKRDQEERGFKFGPSSLGDCLRKQAFLYSGMEPLEPDPEMVRTWEMGHQRGAALEAACKDLWPDAKSQVPVRIPMAGGQDIEGTCDLWIPSMMLVVDFKTQATFGFGLLDTEGVSFEYQLQVHAYRHAIALANDLNAQEISALLVYEAKDSDGRKGIKAQQLKELGVPWSQSLEDALEGRLAAIGAMQASKKIGQLYPSTFPALPRDSKGQKSWKCRYCSVGEERGQCYK